MFACKSAPAKLPILRICNAYVVVGVATLIIERMAKNAIRSGSIIARDPKKQVRGASFNI